MENIEKIFNDIKDIEKNEIEKVITAFSLFLTCDPEYEYNYNFLKNNIDKFEDFRKKFIKKIEIYKNLNDEINERKKEEMKCKLLLDDFYVIPNDTENRIKKINESNFKFIYSNKINIKVEINNKIFKKDFDIDNNDIEKILEELYKKCKMEVKTK